MDHSLSPKTDLVSLDIIVTSICKLYALISNFVSSVFSSPPLLGKYQNDLVGVYRCKIVPPASHLESFRCYPWFLNSMQQVGSHCPLTTSKILERIVFMQKAMKEALRPYFELTNVSGFFQA